MFRFLRRLGVLLALCSAFAATAATAQTSESERVARQIAHHAFTAIGFASIVAQSAKESAASEKIAGFREEWTQFILSSMQEEIEAHSDLMEAVLARRMAKGFTLEELNAGLVIMSDPFFQSVIRAGANDLPTPKGDCSKPCMRALGSSAGMSFMRKFGDEKSDLMGDETVKEMVAVILPGTFRRTADKIEASERARISQ